MRPLVCVKEQLSRNSYLGREEDKRVTGSVASKLRKFKPIESLATYFRQTRAELRKVTWLSRKETLRLTGIVLAVTFAMAAFLGLIDYLFSLLFGLFL